MKKKINSKIILVILLIIGTSLILGTITYLKTPKDKDNKDNLGYKDIKKIIICKSKNCNFDSELYFQYLNTYEGKDKLNKEIKKVNDRTDKYYDLVLNSEFDRKECSNAKKIYNYSLGMRTYTKKHEDSDIISICINRQVIDLCTMKVKEVIEPDIINYDVKKNKLLTQEEFMNKYNVTDEDVKEVIKIEIESFPEKKYNIEDLKDYKLFYNQEDGGIMVSYYIPSLNGYLNTKVR